MKEVNFQSISAKSLLSKKVFVSLLKKNMGQRLVRVICCLRLMWVSMRQGEDMAKIVFLSHG